MNIHEIALKTMGRYQEAHNEMLVSYYMNQESPLAKDHFDGALVQIRKANAILAAHGIALLEEDNEAT